MNRIKRLGDATAFELALAKTPVMVTIVCCIFGVAVVYFSAPFTGLMALMTLIPMIIAFQRIISDNFNGKNRVFCGQFPFTAGERLCAKLTVCMLMFVFYGILLHGTLVVYSVLPDNFHEISLTGIVLDISPNHLPVDIAWYIVITLSSGLFLAATLLTAGAFENKEKKKKKDNKTKIFLRNFFVYIIMFSILTFRSEIEKLLCNKCEDISAIIVIPINLCFAAILIYVSYKKMKQRITD